MRYYIGFAEAIQELRASDVSFQGARAPIRRALDLGADLPSRCALRAEYASSSRKRALPPAIVAKRISFGERLASGSRTGGPILDRIDLSVPGNAFLSIVGESGSGKTTLARVLAGELAADSGSVLVDGAPMQSLSERERFPHLRVRGPRQHGAEHLGAGEPAAGRCGVARRGVYAAPWKSS